MQVIETFYIGPTDTKPSRIRARTSSGVSVVISRDHALSVEGAHAKAADTLRAKLGWSRMFLAGSTKRGFVFAFPPESGARDGAVFIGAE